MADNNRGSSEAFRRRQDARKRREPQTIDAKAEDVTTSPLDETSEPEIGVPQAESDSPSAGAVPAGSAADTDHPFRSSVTDPVEAIEAHRDVGHDPVSARDLTAAPAPTETGGPTARQTSAGEAPDLLASGEPVPLADFVRAADDNSGAGAAMPFGGAHETPQPLRTPMAETGPASDTVPWSDAPSMQRSSDPVTAAQESPSVHSEVSSSGAVEAPEMPDVTRPVRPDDTAPDRSAAEPPLGVAPARSRSLVPAALAGLAALILVGLAGIYYGQQLGSGDLTQKIDALNQRVASLEARPEPQKSPVDLAALQSRSSTLDSDVAALKTAVADLTGKLDQVTQTAAADAARITTLEQHASAAPSDVKAPEVAGAASAPPAVPMPATPPTIATPPETSPPADTASGQGSGSAASTDTTPAAQPPSSAPPASGINQDVAALSGKVEDLSRRLAALPTEPPPSVDLAPLQGRISDLAKGLEAEQAVVAGWPRLDQAALDGRLTGLDRRIDETSKTIDGVAQSVAALPKIDLAPLQASIAAVDQRLVPVEAALSAPKAGDRVTEERAVGSGDESRAAPLAVVAGAIARALDEGQPFGPELAALHGLGLDDAALGPLPALAGPGAPTAGTLRDRWSDLQPKVLTAAGPKTGDSVVDRFAAGALNLVQIRQVGASPDDDPSAVSANIGSALDRGDIAEAVTDWAKLPEPGRAASQSWADAARSRLEADKSVQALMARAIAALAPATH